MEGAEVDNKESANCQELITLRAGFSKVFNEISSSVSNEEFREIMSDTGIKAKTLNKLREMVVDKMKSGLTKDLEEMLRESLADGLIKRHKAVEDSPLSSEEAWRPPGNVKLHMRSLDANVLKEEICYLSGTVAELKQENEQLMKNLVKERAKTAQFQHRLEKSIVKCPDTLQAISKLLPRMENNLNKLADKA